MNAQLTFDRRTQASQGCGSSSPNSNMNALQQDSHGNITFSKPLNDELRSRRGGNLLNPMSNTEAADSRKSNLNSSDNNNFASSILLLNNNPSRVMLPSIGDNEGIMTPGLSPESAPIIGGNSKRIYSNVQSFQIPDQRRQGSGVISDELLADDDSQESGAISPIRNRGVLPQVQAQQSLSSGFDSTLGRAAPKNIALEQDIEPALALTKEIKLITHPLPQASTNQNKFNDTNQSGFNEAARKKAIRSPSFSIKTRKTLEFENRRQSLNKIEQQTKIALPMLSPKRQTTLGKREYLIGDSEDDETENSGFTVSSLDEDLPHTLIAPSTKILRFPMKQDQSQVLEIRILQPSQMNYYESPPMECCCSVTCFLEPFQRCVKCQKKHLDHSGDHDMDADSISHQGDPSSFSRHVDISNAQRPLNQDQNQASSHDQYRREKEQLSAADHWRILRRKLIGQIKMRRMAEYFIKLPSLPEQYIEPTFVETNCPRLQRLLINPMNRKLQYYNQIFNIIVLLDIVYAISLAFDYDRTYHEINGQDIYIIIFIIDFGLNFFKIYSSDVRDIDPLKIAIHYLKTQLIFDLVAMIPYHLLDYNYKEKDSLGGAIRILRLARLSRFVQSARSLIEFFERVFFNYARWIKKRTVQNIASVLWLMIILGFMCHFLSSVWVYIGRRFEDQSSSGWIVRMKTLGLLQNEEVPYKTLYIVGLYYTLTTLSTVGYGDVIGTENLEYWFQMVVMIIGIGFFAYFMGKMNTLFQTSGYSDFQDENLDQWLIRLDKARKTKVLEHEIFQGVQQYFSQYASKEIAAIKEHPFYQQLKPRLQKILFDTLFGDYYTMFGTVFKDTEEEFRRQILLNTRFKMLQRTQPRTHYINSVYVNRYKPLVFSKDEMPKFIYFIVKGSVFFTNESGTFHYFMLSEGSYFGDVNILLNHPSSYSVHFDENADPVLLLAIKREKFLKICDKFPDSKRVMTEMARKRRKQFKIHKIKSLVKLMKVLIRNFNQGFKKIASVDRSYLERQTSIIEMYQLLVAHFRLVTLRKELKKKMKKKLAKSINQTEQKQPNVQQPKKEQRDRSFSVTSQRRPPKSRIIVEQASAQSLQSINHSSPTDNISQISPIPTLQPQGTVLSQVNIDILNSRSIASLSQLDEESQSREVSPSMSERTEQRLGIQGIHLQNRQKILMSAAVKYDFQQYPDDGSSYLYNNRNISRQGLNPNQQSYQNLEDTEVGDPDHYEEPDVHNALPHIVLGSSAVVAAVKPVSNYEYSNSNIQSQRLPQFLERIQSLRSGCTQQKINSREQEASPENQKKKTKEAQGVMPATMHDNNEDHPHIFTVSPKQKADHMQKQSSASKADIIRQQNCEYNALYSNANCPKNLQNQQQVNPTDIILQINNLPESNQLESNLDRPVSSRPLLMIDEEEEEKIVDVLRIPLNEQTTNLVHRNLSQPLQDMEEEKQPSPQNDQLSNIPLYNQNIKGNALSGLPPGNALGIHLLDPNNDESNMQSKGSSNSVNQTNGAGGGSVSQGSWQQQQPQIGLTGFLLKNMIAEDGSRSTRSKKFQKMSEKKKLREYDLETVEREIELIKLKIDHMLSRSGGGTDIKIDVSKNEIVNEYFYDSEEEAQLIAEKDSVKKNQQKIHKMQKGFQQATERLMAEIQALREEQEIFIMNQMETRRQQ